jgi:hypothetical protein
VLVLAVLIVSYASSMRAYLEQQQHLANLRASIAASKAHIAQMQREKRRWNDDAFVVAQARAHLGWVFPGEVGYQVVDENGKPLGQDSTALSDPGAVTRHPRPAWWQSAWGTVVAAGNPKKHRPAPHPVDRIDAPKEKHRR